MDVALTGPDPDRLRSEESFRKYQESLRNKDVVVNFTQESSNLFGMIQPDFDQALLRYLALLECGWAGIDLRSPNDHDEDAGERDDLDTKLASYFNHYSEGRIIVSLRIVPMDKPFMMGNMVDYAGKPFNERKESPYFTEENDRALQTFLYKPHDLPRSSKNEELSRLVSSPGLTKPIRRDAVGNSVLAAMTEAKRAGHERIFVLTYPRAIKSVFTDRNIYVERLGPVVKMDGEEVQAIALDVSRQNIQLMQLSLRNSTKPDIVTTYMDDAQGSVFYSDMHESDAAVAFKYLSTHAARQLGFVANEYSSTRLRREMQPKVGIKQKPMIEEGDELILSR